jgi:hypothetical protein
MKIEVCGVVEDESIPCAISSEIEVTTKGNPT